MPLLHVFILPHSVELTRWSQVDKACQKAVGHAKSIFNSAFSERRSRLACSGMPQRMHATEAWHAGVMLRY